MALDRTKVLEAAQKHLAKGHFERAIAEYQKLVALDPNDVRTWLKIGDLHTRMGNQQKACATYVRVADQYTDQGFFRKAVAVYKQILKLDPTRLDILVALGKMYEQLQLVSDALVTFETVANEYSRRGNTEGALDTLSRMVELDSTNIPIRIRYAEALSKAERTKEAAASFDAGAALLEGLGRTDDYLKVAERLLYHRPDDVALASKLARIYLDREDPKRALSKLQICFQANPRDVQTLELLARSFAMLGQLPKTVSVYKEIARLHQQAGLLEDRAVVLKQIIELDPGDTETRRALASYAPRAPSIRPIAPSEPPPGAVVRSPSAIPLGETSDLEVLEASDSAIFLTDDDSMELTDNNDELEELPSSEFAPVEEASDLLILGDDDGNDDEDVEAFGPAPTDVELAPPHAAINDAHARLGEGAVEDDSLSDIFVSEVTVSDTVDEQGAVPAGLAPDAELSAMPDDERPTSKSDVPSIPPDVAREAQIARLLTECDVFQRYGLRGKVIQALTQVLALAPDHVEARERLKDAHLDGGEQEEAIAHLYALASQFQAERPKVAHLYFRQIQDIDPTSEPAGAAVRAYRSEAPEALWSNPQGSAEGPAATQETAAATAETAARRARVRTDLGWQAREAPLPPGYAPAPTAVSQAEIDVGAAQSLTFAEESPAQDAPSLPNTAGESRESRAESHEAPNEELALPEGALAPPEVVEPDEVLPNRQGLRVPVPPRKPLPAPVAALAPRAPRAVPKASEELPPPQARASEATAAEPWKPPTPARFAAKLATPGAKLRPNSPGPIGRVGTPIGKAPLATTPGSPAPPPRPVAPLFRAPPATKPSPTGEKPAAKFVGVPPSQKKASPARDATPSALAGRPATPAPKVTAAAGGPGPFGARGPQGKAAPPSSRAPLTPQNPSPLSQEEVDELLGEAEFFAEQGLLEEARTTLQDILQQQPEHPAVLARLAELAEEAAAKEVASAPPMAGEDEAFRLAEKLAEELDVNESPTDAGAEMIDVETVFAQFKKGVREQIAPQDSETHFDLGIAYKEMGLLDDAIEEFALAQNNPKKACISRTMIGLCHVEKGALHDAVESFQQGLASPHRSPMETLGLYFELGLAYELLRDPVEAVRYFGLVHEQDPGFRGVARKLGQLQAAAERHRADRSGSARIPPRESVDHELDKLLGKE